jgi:5'-nucleotidase
VHFLLTNDDGIDAPGLAALEKAVRLIPKATLSIVAPASEQSMCGHRITTHSPLKVDSRGDNRWAVYGTPADCVRIGLFALDLKPDWVLSGINAGGNLGQDIMISGTCAAAREATYHQVKAMAFSHYLIRGLAVDWHRVSQWSAELFKNLQSQALGQGDYWCANFPHHPPGELAMPELAHCQPAKSPLLVSYEKHPDGGYLYNASYGDRPRDPGSDVDVCFGGGISVCRIGL